MIYQVLVSWVSKTKRKYSDMKFFKQQTGMGNFTSGNGALSDLENRLLTLKGKASVDGDGVTEEIGLNGSDSE